MELLDCWTVVHLKELFNSWMFGLMIMYYLPFICILRVHLPLLIFNSSTVTISTVTYSICISHQYESRFIACCWLRAQGETSVTRCNMSVQSSNRPAIPRRRAEEPHSYFKLEHDCIAFTLHAI